MDNGLIQLERCIYAERYIVDNEFELLHGIKKNEKVGFAFYNFVKDVVSSVRIMTYRKAISLARERRNDGRYRNYHYYILQCEEP